MPIAIIHPAFLIFCRNPPYAKIYPAFIAPDKRMKKFFRKPFTGLKKYVILSHVADEPPIGTRP